MELDEKETVEASSPSAVAVEEPQPTMPVEDLTDNQRAKWLETGDLPKAAKKEEKSPTPEKDADVKDESPSSDDTKEPEKAEIVEVADPTPAKAPVKTEISPSEARIRELVARTKILEQRLADRDRPPVEVPKVTEEPEPKAENYQDIDDYFAAKVQYALKKDREQREAEQAKFQVETKNKETVERWNNSVIEAKKKYPDFEEKAFSDDFAIKEGSVLDRWCLESEHGTDVLYFYATHPDEYAKLNQIANPMKAAIELARMEVKILEKPAKPAPKLVSDAPPPPKEVSARGTATDDPIADALASGDMSKYMDLMNKKERAELSSRK